MELRCANHPDVETRVSCNKCEKMICFRCMVSTPVGYRCRDCAKVRPNPLTQVSPELYARASGAAALSGAVGALAWGIVKNSGLFGLLSVLLAIGVGYGIGVAVSKAANRRQAPAIGVIAAAGAVGAYIFGNVLGLMFRFDVPASFAFQHALEFRPWDSLWSWLSLALSGAMAYTRARQ
jgi:hypothetical protein